MSDMDELLIRAYYGFEMRKSPELPWASKKPETDMGTKSVAGDVDKKSPTSEKRVAEADILCSARGRRTPFQSTRNAKSPVDAARKDMREWIRSEWDKSSASDSDIVKFKKVTSAAGTTPTLKSNSTTIQVTEHVVKSECVNSTQAGELNETKRSNLSSLHTPSLSMVGNAHLHATGITNEPKSVNRLILASEQQPKNTFVSSNDTKSSIDNSMTISRLTKEIITPMDALEVRKKVIDISLVQYPDATRQVTTDIAISNPRSVESSVLHTDICPDIVKVSPTLVPIARSSSTIFITEPKEIKRMKRKKKMELATTGSSVYSVVKSKEIGKRNNVEELKEYQINQEQPHIPTPETRGYESKIIPEKPKKERKFLKKMVAAKIHPDKTSTTPNGEPIRSVVELSRIADLFCVETEAQAAKRKLTLKVKKQRVAKVAPTMLKSKNNKVPTKRTSEELAEIAALFCVESEEDAIKRRIEQSQISGVDSATRSFQRAVKSSSGKMLKGAYSDNYKQQAGMTTPPEAFIDKSATVNVAWEKEGTVKTDKKRRNPVVKFFRRLLKLERN